MGNYHTIIIDDISIAVSIYLYILNNLLHSIKSKIKGECIFII